MKYRLGKMETHRKFSGISWQGWAQASSLTRLQLPHTARGSTSLTATGSLPSLARACSAFFATAWEQKAEKLSGSRWGKLCLWTLLNVRIIAYLLKKERLAPKITSLEGSFSRTQRVEPCIPDHRLTAQHGSHPTVSWIHLWHWEIPFNTCSPISYMEIIQPFSTEKNEAWGPIKNFDYFNPLKSSRREGA